ncbi:MAG: UDP-3-O-(3-hydroxymyristoyl)glucosamine N-acyltransferase [Alphaproteobacteria bacterium]|nr:UDP-3-O-(3-hydroxymyristoyl)glucosamine N-acyltransferase [Alphaproteobacteria bacterium]
MADPRFYTAKGPFSLAVIAEASGARVGTEPDAARMVADVAPLDRAGPDDLSFLDNKKYVAAFRASRAGASFVHPQFAHQAPAGMALLLSDKPYRSYALAAALFYGDDPAASVRAATAVIDPTARIGAAVSIGHHAVIGPGAEIGARARIGANVTIGRGVVLGEDCVVGAAVSLAYCIIGARTRILAGARIGEDGFGHALDATGHVKVPQLGRVIIGEDVEIGANATIDRGAGPDTVIGDGCKIDNLVQIGHNVQLGRGCILVSQTGISGSTRLGNFVIIGGQGGVAGHLTIGDGARVGAQGGVLKDIPAGASVSGTPAIPVQEWLRGHYLLRRLVGKKDR